MQEPLLAALVALKPMSYLIRIATGAAAFVAASKAENTVTRVIGFVWLLIAGAALLIVGILNVTIVAILLGLVALGAAGYSWWYTRI